EANRACFTTSELNRWSADRPVDITDLEVDPNAGFNFGMYATESWLSLFDYRMGQVAILDTSLRTVRRIARPGHGPGEILPVGGLSHVIPKGRRVDWIDGSGD